MLQSKVVCMDRFAIQPQEKKPGYDKEMVMMLSDWDPNEKPMDVLRNFKRGQMKWVMAFEKVRPHL